MIQTKDLCVYYNRKLVVRDATLLVPTGKIGAIVGPSGCGKSSFMMSLNRMTDLIPDASTTGDVVIDGKNIHDPGTVLVELRRTVGMIFQKPNPFPMSIRKNIQLALREHGIGSRTQLTEITERVLKDVGLWDEVKDRLDQSALKLSGGQQQRLCFARALALEPKVLLLDEPCSALDPIASKHVESLILELRGRYTIVIVTHNLAQARRLADQLAVFWFKDGAGQIIEQGETESVFSNPQNRTTAAYIAGAQG